MNGDLVDFVLFCILLSEHRVTYRRLSIPLEQICPSAVSRFPWPRAPKVVHHQEDCKVGMWGTDRLWNTCGTGGILLCVATLRLGFSGLILLQFYRRQRWGEAVGPEAHRTGIKPTYSWLQSRYLFYYPRFCLYHTIFTFPLTLKILFFTTWRTVTLR